MPSVISLFFIVKSIAVKPSGILSSQTSRGVGLFISGGVFTRIEFVVIVGQRPLVS